MQDLEFRITLALSDVLRQQIWVERGATEHNLLIAVIRFHQELA